MSNEAHPDLRTLAQALLDREASSGAPAADEFHALSGVCMKLRTPICTLASPVGFRALLGRALTLAKMEAPGLETVKVASDGTLEGSLMTKPSHGREAGATLVAHLLGLLATFIGGALTERLLSDIWPDIPKLDKIPKVPEP